MDSTITYSPKEDNCVKMDILSFEQNQRKFQTELIMKRNQVRQLRDDLDTANIKIHELTRKLENAASVNENMEYDLMLTRKNLRMMEEKLQDKKDPVVKLRFQQDIMMSENQALKEMLQQAELEKCNFLRKIEDLNSQHYIDSTNQKELMEQDAKIRNMLAQYSEIIHSVGKDQNVIEEMTNKINVCEQLTKSLEFYKNQYLKIKDDKELTEETLTLTQAKFETLQNLLLSHPLPTQMDSSFMYNVYAKSIENVRSELILQRELAVGLSNRLNEEQKTNAMLIKNNDDLTNQLAKFNITVTDGQTQTDGDMLNNIVADVKIKMENDNVIIIE